MARSSMVTSGTHSSAIATDVTEITIQNLGPGVAFVVFAASAPTVDPGDVGYRLHADEGMHIDGLTPSNVYIGALAGNVEVEFTAI